MSPTNFNEIITTRHHHFRAMSSNARIHRDEVKTIQQAKKKKKELAATLKSACDALIANPKLWYEAEFKPVRSIAYRVTRDPVKYPPPPGLENVGIGESLQLSGGFVDDVYRARIKGRDCLPYSPVL